MMEINTTPSIVNMIWKNQNKKRTRLNKNKSILKF